MKYNIEFEKILLSTIKLYNNIYDEINLKADDFYDIKHQKIFDCMGKLLNLNQEINDITLYDRLKDSLDIKYIISLDVANTGNIKFYEKKIKEFSIKRKLYKLSLVLQDSLKSEDIDKTIELVDMELLKIQDIENSGYKHIKDLLLIHIDLLEKRYKGEIKKYLKVGYENLDNILRGLRPGQLIVIAARASIGKSTFMLNLMNNISQHSGVGIFSSEMEAESLMDKIISINTGIDLTLMENAKFMANDFNKIMDIASNLANRNIYIDDTPNITLSKLKARARKMRRDKVKIIFIDYLTLIGYENKAMNRPERVGFISKSLKNLARELGIPIVVLSQLNRNSENKMPSLADLRQSGEIEEDADKILLIDKNRKENEGLIIVAKNRLGPTGGVKIYFNLKTGSIKELCDE